MYVDIRILDQHLIALDKIHRKNIVNKDIKLENTIRELEGNVKLADYRITKILAFEGEIGMTIPYSRTTMHQSSPAREVRH